MKLLFIIVIAGLFGLAGCHAPPRDIQPGRIHATTTRDARTTTSFSYAAVFVPKVPVSAPTAEGTPAVRFIPAQGGGGYLILPSTSVDAATHAVFDGDALNDGNPRGPVTLNVPGIAGATDGSQDAPKPDVALGALSDHSWIIAGIAMGLGALITVLSFIPQVKLVFPIPVWIGPAVAALGVAILCLPVLLDRYGWILPVAACAIALGWAIHLAIVHGWLQRQVAAGAAPAVAK